MNRFEVIDTPLIGVKHVIRTPLEDSRGSLERMFCADDLFDAGWEKPIKQINKTHTKKSGTLRGMHFQIPPFSEYKFISCLNGSVLDVVVDLRKGSETFLHSYAIELSTENHDSLLIPEGVAHGFQTLTDDVTMLYFHSEVYSPDHEDSLHPQDPALGISWPLDISVISDRDNSKEFLSQNFDGIIL